MTTTTNNGVDVAHPRPVPTVAQVKQAARRLCPGIDRIEVGLRLDVDGEPTFDATRWADDADLDDLHPIADLLRAARQGDVPLQADLYCYGTTGWGESELLANLDLVTDGAQWRVVDPFAG